MNISKLMRPGCLTCRSAFTLVEVMVGLAVAGVAIFGLYAGITYGFAVTKATRENLRATQLMMEKFETIRLYTWEQINGINGFVIPKTFVDTYAVDATKTNSGILYNGTMTIAPAPLSASYKDDLRLVTVTMNWVSGNVQRNRQMMTLVARQGLQQYVY